MKTNVKPGDLAIIIGGYFDHIGKIIEVLSPSILVGYWKVRFQNPVLVVAVPINYSNSFYKNKSFIGTEVDMQDKYLRPVSGLPIGEDIGEDIEKKEELTV